MTFLPRQKEDLRAVFFFPQTAGRGEGFVAGAGVFALLGDGDVHSLNGVAHGAQIAGNSTLFSACLYQHRLAVIHPMGKGNQPSVTNSRGSSFTADLTSYGWHFLDAEISSNSV
jgi:hypothetical protein